MWQPSRIKIVSKVTTKEQKCSQQRSGGTLPGGGVTLDMCAIVPCNVEQAVCAVHTCSSLPGCWGQASSKSGRGGPV